MDYHQPRFYHFSEDSIWLSKKASELSPNACSVLDIGCGSGVVGIETLNRLKSPKELILLEPQVEFLEYIQNNLEFIERNIEVEIVNQTLERFNPGRKYDLIVSNPPYFNPKESRPSRDINRLKCRTFENLNLFDFVQIAIGHLNPSGEFYFLARQENPDVKKILSELKGFKVIDQFKDVLLLNFVHE